jgi:hypothetical protein
VIRFERIADDPTDSLNPAPTTVFTSLSATVRIIPSEISNFQSFHIGSDADFVASPRSLGGKNMRTIHVHLKEGVDADYERAQAAGATIIQEADWFLLYQETGVASIVFNWNNPT